MVWYSFAHIHPTHYNVPRKSVIVHDEKFQRNELEVHVRDVEMEGFVEDRSECVLLGGRLPLFDAVPIIYQPDLDVRVF